MLGRRRTAALEERLTRLEVRAAFSEVLFSAIAGAALRAVPDDVRDQIFRDIRATVTCGAAGSELQAEFLEVEEHAAQIIDQIEGIARREF